ncbi:choice-of-anchor I family protein [Psychrosphaera haliotis]|uniref:Collagen-like protein n=1 Tax=Psychrosphaera haliotis TaxID=555083 RepID=A0A6N8F4V6_9GAMM|nr:choice-of-anchor I family protein [Psychrosphaera haliotis]MUH71208.1 collagen-like protein [Psychrosphaera haliotis]
MKQAKSLIMVALFTALTGCDLDGSDGENGVSGTNGTNGIDGVNGVNGEAGKDAPTSLTSTLVARAVLNANSPEGAAEIVAFQKSTKWIYAINSSVSPAVVEVLDTNDLDPNALTKDAEGVVTNTNLTSAITVNLSDTATLDGDANSIAVDDVNELLAVAVASGTPGVNGHIAFYDISGAAPAFIKNVEVGDLPDNVAFTHDGAKVIVANEGEPSSDYTIDPEGTISIINILDGVPADVATMISLTGYNDQQEALEAQGAKFSNPTGQTIKGEVRAYTVAQDLEPEYVAVSEDNSTAFVSLQENNALAIVDLSDNSVQVIGLGFKDWSQYKLDVSDKDEGINLKSYDNLYGMYQPDTIASFNWQGANFIVSANEGDGREYIAFERDAAEDEGKNECETDFPDGIYDWDDGEEVCIAFTDESRVKDLEDFAPVTAELDAYVSEQGGKDGLGRLLITNALGKNADGEYEKLYAYGARSFTIWDQNGLVVFDSGDEIARITASIHGASFNNDEDENTGDTRSDAKGAEPEALTLGKIGEQTYAFVGLERMGGILAYDISNPYNVKFVDYFYNRGLTEGADITGDLAPEGMKFVAAGDSPTGEALLIVGNEISGSVAVWQIEQK